MNIELRFLAAMLHHGDFRPLSTGEITVDHFETDSGKVIFDFIKGYRRTTNGDAQWPSLSIVRQRFKNAAIELPDPDPGERVDALMHETKLEHFRAKLRETAAEMEIIAQSSSDPYGDVLPVVTKLRKSTEVLQRNKHVSLSTGILEAMMNYDTGMLLPDGIPWPWPMLTKATKGLHRKEFIVFAGRPKSRKTFTALRVGTHAVKHHFARVLLFSPEMPVQQMMLRVVAHFCDLRYTEFKDGTLEEEDKWRLYEAAEKFGFLDGESDDDYMCRLQCNIPDMPTGARPSFDIVQSTGRDVSWMESQIELYQPDIVICDSFYRQKADGAKKNDTDWKAVSALSRELKDMFMNMNVAGLGTHQLNRGAERSVGDLSNLGLADAIGQDADGIYRIVTGKVNGEDVSALLNLGGREVPFDGIMINNKPCYDYNERGEIVNKKQVEQLMQQEESEEAKEANDEMAKKQEEGRKSGRPKNSSTASQIQKPNRYAKDISGAAADELSKDQDEDAK